MNWFYHRCSLGSVLKLHNIDNVAIKPKFKHAKYTYETYSSHIRSGATQDSFQSILIGENHRQ